MKVTLLLADSAQAVNGKLYILGGGWSFTGPGPSSMGLAMKIDVPWDQSNRRHTLRVELKDADGKPATFPTPAGEGRVSIESNFEVGRPAGIKEGTPLDLTMAFNVGPIQLPPDQRFEWVVIIDDQSESDWRAGFTTRPATTSPDRPL